MIEQLEIPDLIVVSPKIFPDPRGYFMEAYKKSVYREVGIPSDVDQRNRSRSLRRGVLRGLHYQLNPCAQAKFVEVQSGRIFDVAVDLRRGSPTYGKWAGVELSEENGKQFWIPAGFAHGFITLEDDTRVEYCCYGAEYAPTHERSIIWNDPTLNISWPIAPNEDGLSPKDASAPTFELAEMNFVYGEE